MGFVPCTFQEVPGAWLNVHGHFETLGNVVDDTIEFFSHDGRAMLSPNERKLKTARFDEMTA
jgi:hypothetical protein